MSTKTERVYNSLKQKILSGGVKPGERLIIRRLAKQYQISDIPVREALKMLERDGLIGFVPYGGAKVIELSPQEIKESLLIRSRLEGLAARLAAPILTFADGRELRRVIDEMEQCIERRNYHQYGNLNKKFHRYIYSLAPYPKLRGLIESTWNESAQMRAVFSLIPERAAASNDEHRIIMDALEAGDEVRAEKLVQEHKWHTAENLFHYIEKSKSQNMDDPV
jgi:DNA-binding GntR family transcriptional regulator